MTDIEWVREQAGKNEIKSLLTREFRIIQGHAGWLYVRLPECQGRGHWGHYLNLARGWRELVYMVRECPGFLRDLAARVRDFERRCRAESENQGEPVRVGPASPHVMPGAEVPPPAT